MLSLLPLLLSIVEESPMLFTDGAALFNSIAHGEGGIQKVQKVAAALSTLSGHAAAAAASATAAHAAAQPPAAA